MGIRISRNHDRSGATVNGNDANETSSRNVVGDLRVEWGGRREEGSGWGTHVYLWRIHFDIWQN